MGNVLFICKYNRFRSKVAEAYFNKVKKEGWNVKSAGIFPGWPLDHEILDSAKKFDLTLENSTSGLTYQLGMWSDKIVIVEDTINPGIFDRLEKKEKKELIVWKIADVEEGDLEGRKRVIEEICKKVDEMLDE